MAKIEAQFGCKVYTHHRLKGFLLGQFSSGGDGNSAFQTDTLKLLAL